MREQEMRLRVFRFLKARMRNMIMPATLGIGLAVGGCGDSNEGPVVRYAAPVLPDASPDLGPDTAGWTLNQDVGTGEPDVTGAPDLLADVAAESVPDVATSEDAKPSDVLAAEAGLDARPLDGTDDGGKAEHASPYEVPVLDSRTEAGQVIAKYIAPMLDATVDDAGSPDRSMAVLYMAQLPS
jgi:hypothetical protein